MPLIRTIPLMLRLPEQCQILSGVYVPAGSAAMIRVG